MSKSIQIIKRSTVNLPELSSYKLVIDAVEAVDMPDKIFVKQRIKNFAKDRIDDTFVAIATPTQLEDFDEDAPADGSSFFRTNSIELVMRTPELLQEVFDSLMYEVKKLVVDLEDIEKLSDEEVFLVESDQPISVIPTKPSAVTITSIEGGERMLTIYFNPPTQIGVNPLITYQYSVDAGNTWEYRQPVGLASPILVENLKDATTYGVMVRAVTKNNVGIDSSVVYATTL
jgi:hypothetical protein